MTHKSYTLAELTKGLDVTIQGDPACIITGVSAIQNANTGHITFLTNAHYRKYLSDTKASAVITDEASAVECKGNVVISKNPYFTYAKIASFYHAASAKVAGVHASAVLGVACEIDETASIGPNCVLGNRVKVGASVVIGPGCVIGDEVTIDEESTLDANVTLYYRVKIGKRTKLSSGVVLGSDGFGFANQKGQWHKVPQLGTVVIGDNVDIGANTVIDRGAVLDTVIENGVILDNLVQVAHNVHIGENTAVAGCTGIAGSTTIGKNCMIGGAARITGHISICDNVVVTGATGVAKSITEPGMYASGIVGAVPYEEYRKNNARFHRLSNLVERVKALESELKSIKETDSE